MKNFEDYLNSRGLSDRTIEIYTQLYGYFDNWLTDRDITAVGATYNDVMDFIADCRKQNHSNQHINNILSAVRHHYYYLIEEELVSHNVVSKVFLKSDSPRKVVGDVIEYSKLENFYHEYSAKTYPEIQEKVVLGLIIFQAVRQFEIDKLLVSDIDFEKGTLHLPEDKRVNNRVMMLYPQQILALYRYADQFLKPTDRLLGDIPARNVVVRLFRKLSKAYGITGIHEIRTATIVHWLKSGNLREVQYMCGHKYVSSTEKYKMDSLEELQDEIEVLHPLN